MKMRIALMALALMIVVAGVAWAQDAPAVDIPVYPNGDVTMEINMSNSDILPMLKAMMPMLSGKMGKMLEQVSPEDIASALKDVTQIELLQFEVAKPAVKGTDIADFYTKKVPAGKWTRVFWQSQPGKTDIMAVYAQSGMTSLYGYKIETVTSNGKPINRVQVAKIQGKIDFAKLLEIASKIMAAK